LAKDHLGEVEVSSGAAIGGALIRVSNRLLQKQAVGKNRTKKGTSFLLPSLRR